MENYSSNPKSKKKIYLLTSVLALLLCSIGFASFLVSKSDSPFFSNLKERISDLFTAEELFSILGMSDTNQKKVPLDAKYFDFTLSQNIDASTVNKENFKITPFVDGELKVVNGNTIQYVLGEKLKDGQNFNVTISKNIKSEKGKNLDKDYNFDIDIVSSVKVTKINPEGNLENLYQNIAVFFNIPMVPLTNLDNRDKLPCPVVITPKVEGTCKWTTTSVLEFVPSTHFQGSTNYTVGIVNMTGLNYPISENKKVTVTTPKLDLYVHNQFNPKYGIDLVFNFPVKLEDVKQKFTLKEDGKVKLVEITQMSGSDSSDGSESLFNVKLVGDNYIYNKSYEIAVSDGLMPKYGNIKMGSFQKSISTYNFLENIEIYQNKYSETGVLINTKSYYYSVNNNYGYGYSNNNNFLPKDDLFFQVSFQEEVSLDKTNYAFLSSDGKAIDYKINYVQEEVTNEDQTKTTIVDNKKKLKITLKSDLENDKTYKFVIYKKSNPNLEQDIVTAYRTSPKFSVKDFKFLAYNKSCLYLSNPIDFYDANDNYDEKSVFDHISTNPASRISTIYYRAVYNPNDNRYEECPKPKQGEYLHVIETRLNPFSDYKISVTKGLKDIYGNLLQDSYSKAVKTQGISEKDKYLYSTNNYKSLIPSNLPLVVNLQTINIDSLKFEACQMDLNGYFQFLIAQEGQNNNNYGYGYENSYDYGYSSTSGQVEKGLPFCKNDKIKTLKVKNKYWAISNNKFDLEKDIFGSKFSENFVYIRGSLYGFTDFQKQDYNRKFENIYLRSNISMALEKGSNKNLLFITSIDGKNTIGDLKLSFYKFNKGAFKLVNVKYNFNKEKGVYEFEDNLDLRFIVASKGTNFGILDMNSDALSNYDFKYIAGEPTSIKNYLYLYTDRPLYKPGDTVYFKGLLRNFNFDGYKKSSIKVGKLQIVDENDKLIKELDIKLDLNSNFDGQFNIPDDIGLGRFGFKFFVDEKYIHQDDEYGYYEGFIGTNAYFYVEEYRKPTFKVDATSDKNDFTLGENTNIKVEPKYYFGGKMTNTKGTYSIISQSYFFDAKDYSDYQFGEGYEYFDCLYRDSCSYSDQYYDSKEFDIDENGLYSFKYLFPQKDTQGNLLGEKIFSFNFDVVDPDTKRTVNKTVSQVLHNTDGYVGIQIPYWNAKQKGIDFKGIVLDRNAQPKKADISIQVIKQERQSVKKEGLNGVFYSEYTMKETLEKELVLTSNDKGEIAKNIETKSDGEYLIKAVYKGSNEKEFVSSQNIYVGGDSDNYYLRNVGNNSVTELVADKNMVNVGDEQNFMLKSPVDNGKTLIVIEKDDGILDYFVHDIKSFSDNITIPVKDTYYPNFYVKVFLIGSQDKNPLPVYKRALAITKVNTEYKDLQVKILTDKTNYLPGDKVKITIKVTDSNGNAVKDANGSIAVVDQSLLALKGNPVKNPYAFFYDMKRYLGITTFSPLAYLVEKLEIKDSSDGSKGGDGPQLKGGNSKKKRGVFKDTAFWYANFKTNASGIYEFTTEKLPDNLTTWVVETLVNTPTDNKIGVNTMTFETNKKIMISDNLPQVFGSLDEISLSPVIFNKMGKAGEFEVSLTASYSKVNNSVQKISLADGEQKTVYFKLNIEDIGINENKNNAVSEINIKVKSLSTDDEDQIQKFVQIKETSTPEFVATVGKTADVSYDEKIQVGAVLNNAGLLKVNYGATLFTSLLDGIDYLQNYPYGCLEQRTSSIMPNVYIKKLYTSAGKEFDLKKKMIKYRESAEEGYKEISVDETIKNYLVEIAKFQKSDGGFVYRYDISYTPKYSDFVLTNYLVQSVSEIKSLGYTADDNRLKNAVKYIKNRFYKNQIEGCAVTTYNNCKYSEEQRLDAINTVLSYNPNDYEGYKMWNQLDFKYDTRSVRIQKSKVISKLIKLSSVSAQEKESLKKIAVDTINEMLNQDLVFGPKEAYIGKSDTRSRLETTTKFLETISLVGLENFNDIESITDNINRWIIGQKKNGNYGSTRENMSVIKAITAYLEKSGELKDVNMAVKIKINSSLIDTKSINNENKLAVFTKILNLNSLKANNTFNIEKNGKGTVYYDLNLSYYLSSTDIKSRDEGFFVEKQYYSYNEFKKIQSLKQKEMADYYDHKIGYEQMKYPKNTIFYLTPIKDAKVGDLLIVYNKFITSETRDQVSFEGFVPAGSELINPNLDTSTKINTNLAGNMENGEGSTYGYNSSYDYGYSYGASNGYNGEGYSDSDYQTTYSDGISMLGVGLFQKTEFRADRFFGFTYSLQPGIYELIYLIRVTHNGKFNIKPTMIGEFYNQEVFGRSKGEVMEVK